MLIAFDTATAATVVAVGTADGTLLAEHRHEPGAGERPGHLTWLLPLAERALADAGAGWQSVTRVGAGAGPGGFTGLRIGLATAAGIALARAVETVPLSSLALLAAGCEPVPSLLALVDARRGELFAQRFSAGAAAGDPFVAAPGSLTALGGVLAVGDGAIRHRALLAAAGARIPDDADRRHTIGGAALVRITASAAPGPALPLYLREPDAVPKAART